MIKPLWIATNWEATKEMGIPDHLICLLRNLYAGQKQVRALCETTNWFKIEKGVHQGCILSPCLLNLYAEYIMQVFVAAHGLSLVAGSRGYSFHARSSQCGELLLSRSTGSRLRALLSRGMQDPPRPRVESMSSVLAVKFLTILVVVAGKYFF